MPAAYIKYLREAPNVLRERESRKRKKKERHPIPIQSTEFLYNSIRVHVI